MITVPIAGLANLPHVNKFVVILDCGHKILYDHSVDDIEEYKEGDLSCYECQYEMWSYYGKHTDRLP